MLINMFDTAIDSDNLGDHIIMDAVWRIALSLFPDAVFHRTPTHRRPTLAEFHGGRKAAFSIVGGTNILKSHMLVRGNWRITPLDYLAWRNVILLGVGWQHYAAAADPASRLFFRMVLARSGLHAVRDHYTYDHLHRDVPNLVYTACPTMWALDGPACRAIPASKGRDAIFAVTHYRPAPAQDRAVFDLLKRHYRRVFVWPQQSGDIPYLRSIGITDFQSIKADLAAFDRVLDEGDVDFVGARLHGGIRALQRGRRSLIIPVDNRAIEISRFTNLPVESRDRPDLIEHWIVTPRPTAIALPEAAIDRWKGQFTSIPYAAGAPAAAAATAR
jgi:hypothetical protein